jgi:hypothetical protein
MSQTTEHVFETYVEEILLTRGGWKTGSNAEWDKERALFPAQVFAFIADTQPKLWQAMRDLHAAGLEALMLMVQRMADNDKIVSRYMDDKAFGDAAFTVLSKAIYDSIPTEDDTAIPA